MPVAEQDRVDELVAVERVVGAFALVDQGGTCPDVAAPDMRVPRNLMLVEGDRFSPVVFRPQQAVAFRGPFIVRVDFSRHGALPVPSASARAFLMASSRLAAPVCCLISSSYASDIAVLMPCAFAFIR